MPQFRPKPALERSAVADLFRQTLSKIPTVFGQLGYLASLRDTDTGIYRHHGLAARFGREGSRDALFECHRRVFHQWLNLSLEEKKNDLDQYLADLTEAPSLVLRHWAETPVQQLFPPATARRSERTLFLEEFRVLLQLLRCGAKGGLKP